MARPVEVSNTTSPIRPPAVGDDEQLRRRTPSRLRPDAFCMAVTACVVLHFLLGGRVALPLASIHLRFR